jgi:hypothetical protein
MAALSDFDLLKHPFKLGFLYYLCAPKADDPVAQLDRETAF